MLTFIAGLVVGACVATLTRPTPPLPPPDEELVCPRCKRPLHDHAPECRHSPARKA